MKKAIFIGLIAGFVTGIVNFIFQAYALEIPLMSGLIVTPGDITAIALAEMMIGIMWGVIFSLFYAHFYDYIPSVGIKKGLIYGMIVWTIANFRYAVISMSEGFFLWSFSYALSRFLSFGIIYGLLIGILYKKGD